MTKTHVHIPSGKHDYKFVVERREVEPNTSSTLIVATGKTVSFFVVEKEKRFELAVWFAHQVTASEMALKATRGDQFCNAIPCVAYGTPIPRPEGSWFRPQEYSGRK